MRTTERGWVRLHSYGSIWHMLNGAGGALCARSLPPDAVWSQEPRSPGSYICAKCYRIDNGLDPNPGLVAFACLESLGDRLTAIEGHLGISRGVSRPRDDQRDVEERLEAVERAVAGLVPVRAGDPS